MENPDGLIAANTAAAPETAVAPPELTRASLAGLRETGVLSASAWEEAMAFCGFRPGAREWYAYLRHILLLGGALFLVAGVIFFIAWNWAGMHRFARMGLVGLFVAAAGLGAVWRGPDTNLGRVLLLSCGLLVGPMLAVFGQTYQTGAELWELFRVWTVMLFALAVAGRQAGLWFAAWISGNIFVMLWLGRSMDSPLEALGMFSLLPECLLALALAVAVWEWAAFRARRKDDAVPGYAWLRSRWLPRLLFFDLTVRLTAYLCLVIVSRYGAIPLPVQGLPYQPLVPVLALAVAGVSWFWYRKRAPDLFMPACLVAACMVLIVAVLLRAEFMFDAGVGAVFVWGLLIVGLTAGSAKILLTMQKEMGKERGETEKKRAGQALSAFFAPALPAPCWQALWADLRGKGLLPQDEPLPEAPAGDAAPASPWYVRTMLAVGGWVAAVLFVVFLALFLFVSLSIRGDEGAALFAASLVPLAVGAACLRCRGGFSRHFGFSLALAGSIAACVGLGMMLGENARYILALAFAALLAGLSLAMRSAAYRFLASLAVVQLVAVGIVTLAIKGMARWGEAGPGELARLCGMGVHMTIAWWSAVGLALAVLYLKEKEWLGSPAATVLSPALSGAYGGMMAYLLIALGSRVSDIAYGEWRFWFPASHAVGVGCAVGLVFLAWKLAARRDRAAERAAVLGCAVLCLPLGWFLPGVALAAFGLSLSRYLGSRVMQGVTGAFLLAYMVYYYYFLGISLLDKSMLLSATGALLLGLAGILKRFGGCAEAEGPHA